MNLEQLAYKTADVVEFQMTKKEAKEFTATLLDVITEELTNGGSVDLYGFGKFSVTERAARMAKNPQTGEEVPVSAKRVAKFKPLKKLKDSLNK